MRRYNKGRTCRMPVKAACVVPVKPNCSIQSYVPALSPLLDFGIEKISVCTYQAISGAGKTFADWPEMVGNMIPFIGGEEEKSEKEPLKIWGQIENDEIVPVASPSITAQCLRVACAWWVRPWWLVESIDMLPAYRRGGQPSSGAIPSG